MAAPGPDISFLSVPLWEKSNLVFIRPNTKASVQKSCAMPKPRPVPSRPVPGGYVGCSWLCSRCCCVQAALGVHAPRAWGLHADRAVEGHAWGEQLGEAGRQQELW